MLGFPAAQGVWQAYALRMTSVWQMSAIWEESGESGGQRVKFGWGAGRNASGPKPARSADRARIGGSLGPDVPPLPADAIDRPPGDLRTGNARGHSGPDPGGTARSPRGAAARPRPNARRVVRRRRTARREAGASWSPPWPGCTGGLRPSTWGRRSTGAGSGRAAAQQGQAEKRAESTSAPAGSGIGAGGAADRTDHSAGQGQRARAGSRRGWRNSLPGVMPSWCERPPLISSTM